MFYTFAVPICSVVLTCSLLSFESVSLSALPYLTPSLLLVAEGLSTYGSLLEPLAVQPFFTNLLSFVVTYLKKHGKEPFSDQGLLVSLIDLLDKSTIIDIRNKMVSKFIMAAHLFLLILSLGFVESVERYASGRHSRQGHTRWSTVLAAITENDTNISCCTLSL